MLPLSIKARLTGRAYWSLRYTDGKVVKETDCDWSEAPQRGRACLTLYCPNGERAELGNDQDATGRLFQFKVGQLSAGLGRSTLAHVIGIVTKTNGECLYAAWDYGQGKLVHGVDNVQDMQYQQVGRLALAPMGLT